MQEINQNTILMGIEKYFTIFFYGSSIFTLCLIVQGIILTLANIFSLPWILVSCLISIAFTVLFLYSTRRDIHLLSKISFPMIIFTLLILGVMIFFPHDTIGGRDESAYSNMAIYLAQKGTLNLPEHLKNLPGNYAEGLRSRLPAYTVWLGIIYVIAGLDGLFRANALLVTLGLLSFFLTVASFSNRKIALFASILLGSSMPFLWFMRETMTENLFFLVLWFLILSLITYIKNRNVWFLVVVFLSSSILSLTRIEGAFIMGTVIFAIIIHTIRTKRKNIVGIVLACGILVTTSLSIIRVFGFSPYFVDNLESSQSVFKQEVTTLVSNTFQTRSRLEAQIQQTKHNFLYSRMPEFNLAMLHKYNFVIILFSILLLTSAAIFGKKNKFSRTYFLLIIFIILPEFYKLISPSVTLDQPWFYRRYLYALLPLGYLSLVIVLSKVNRRMSTLIVILLFTINILFSSNIMFLRNNWTLIDMLNKITADISPNDLVIVEERPLGYYSPISFLIINKRVRSMSSISYSNEFLPEMKLFNDVSYGRTFLLSTKKHENYLDFGISNSSSVDLSYNQLKPLCQTYEIGLQEKYKDPYDFNLIPYELAMYHCAKTVNVIENHNETLYLYELGSK